MNTKRNPDISGSAKSPVLSELAVEHATGSIREIYFALEASLQVRLVNLVYRHLATVPGALEWAWGTVGPAFEGSLFAEQSIALVPAGDLVATGQVSLSGCGLSEAESDRVRETLDAYNRANPMNALSLRVISMALEAGRPSEFRRPQAREAGNLSELLPMAALDELAPQTMDVLYRLAWLTTGQDRGLVPSLFRHFTPWPALLMALADWLEPLVQAGQIDAQLVAISDKADVIARDIFENLGQPGDCAVLPDAATRETLAQTIEIFPSAICRMIVIGGLLRGALKS